MCIQAGWAPLRSTGKTRRLRGSPVLSSKKDGYSDLHKDDTDGSRLLGCQLTQRSSSRLMKPPHHPRQARQQPVPLARYLRQEGPRAWWRVMREFSSAPQDNWVRWTFLDQPTCDSGGRLD